MTTAARGVAATRRVGARSRPAAAMVAVVLMLAACTSDGEQATPPPPAPEAPPATTPAAGIRIGFVLPPAASDEDDQRAQLAGDLQLVSALRDEGISEIRTLEPDGPEFVPDLAALLADRGTDLICVLGPGAQRVVAPLAVRHPQLSFCAVPAGSTDPPDNVTAVDVRFEELGHLLGVAATVAADGGPVASILGTDRAGVTGLRDGIRTGVGGVALLESAPSDEEEVLAAVDVAIAEDAEVVIIDVGIAVHAAVERAAAGGLQVLAPSAVLTELDVGEATVLTWRLRWDVALRPVVASMLDPDLEVPTSVGFADSVFLVTSGDRLTGAARMLVDEAANELRRGARDPLEEPAPSPAPAEEDEAGDGGDAEPDEGETRGQDAGGDDAADDGGT
jgi:hypothetical protein